jgi:hypothetical protein
MQLTKRSQFSSESGTQTRNQRHREQAPPTEQSHPPLHNPTFTQSVPAQRTQQDGFPQLVDMLGPVAHHPPGQLHGPGDPNDGIHENRRRSPFAL